MKKSISKNLEIQKIKKYLPISIGRHIGHGFGARVIGQIGELQVRNVVLIRSAWRVWRNLEQRRGFRVGAVLEQRAARHPLLLGRGRRREHVVAPLAQAEAAESEVQLLDARHTLLGRGPGRRLGTGRPGRAAGRAERRQERQLGSEIEVVEVGHPGKVPAA